MGENSKIQWTDDTANFWRGCQKISPGCMNCYAEQMSKRNPAVLGEWGPEGKRVIAAESYWQKPLRWNRAAEKAGERRRVFSLSLGDWLEDRPELVDPRARLLWTVSQTPALDWLLLSKRVEDWRRLLEQIANHPAYEAGAELARLWLCGQAPANVWVGASVEDQEQADERIPQLLRIPADVRFLSCEPLLGEIDLKLTVKFLGGSESVKDIASDLHWVIAGGESGPNARPMHPAWPASLRDQCRVAKIPFFFKQWGQFLSYTHGYLHADELSKHKLITVDLDGRYLSDEDDDRQAALMVRVGKKAAGRILDGREWNEMPRVGSPAVREVVNAR